MESLTTVPGMHCRRLHGERRYTGQPIVEACQPTKEKPKFHLQSMAHHRCVIAIMFEHGDKIVCHVAQVFQPDRLTSSISIAVPVSRVAPTRGINPFRKFQNNLIILRNRREA